MTDKKEEIYRRTLRVQSRDVDLHRRLRLSALFTLLQEAAAAHTEALGAGPDRLFDVGLLWVVALQRVRIARLPAYGEEIALASWPGRTMHALFPRYYRIADAAGNVIIEASAFWALMDAETRSFGFPGERGIAIGGVVTGQESPLPHMPMPLDAGATRSFTVPYSYIDLNGHMNNARYLDLAEDLMPPEMRARAARDIAVEYSSEIRMGDPLTLRYGQTADVFFLSGERESRLFRLWIAYA